MDNLLPKEYFEDEISVGVANGTFNYLKKQRFTITNLPVGYGKTIIAVLTALKIAQEMNTDVQIGIIAPKAKRLDGSFRRALDSATEYYGFNFSPLYINGQMIGTFQGFNRVAADKKLLKSLVDTIKKKPTIFILDETHMSLRDATSKTSKGFYKMFRHLEKAGAFVKVIGLTATPVDTSILDAIGYMIFNGNYTSMSDFFRREVIGFKEARARGLTIRNVETMILDDQYRINKDMFLDYKRVLETFDKILYRPKAPRTFHIPENELIDTPVQLTEGSYKRLERLNRMDKQKAFPDNATRKISYLECYTTDENMLNKVFEIISDKNTVQPLIFYQHNIQRDLLRKKFTEQGINYTEISGDSHSYFDEANKGVSSPVIVQYKSGSAAFESYLSNTSIYLSLPESSIDFEQSLGRNARREQNVDKIKNYILLPVEKNGELSSQVAEAYKRIENKTKQNIEFLKNFESEWLEFEMNV